MLGREFIKALAVAATVWPLAAQAQTYASRPVVMVVPYAAGGTFDVMSRILATRMSEVLGQPVIVENTTGRQGHHRREPRHQRRAPVLRAADGARGAQRSSPLATAAVTSAPPVLEGPGPTVEYMCGNCGAALMRVDHSKAHILMVHCTSCDIYNSTAD
jgi:hypothetical protein